MFKGRGPRHRNERRFPGFAERYIEEKYIDDGRRKRVRAARKPAIARITAAYVRH